MNHITADYKIFSESGAELSRIPWDETIDIHAHEHFGVWINFFGHKTRINGYEIWPPTRKIINRITNEYSIHFVIEGKGSFNGEPIKKGSAFVIVPNEPHSIISDPDEPLKLYWMIISPWYSSEFWKRVCNKFNDSYIVNMHSLVQEQIFGYFSQMFEPKNILDRAKATYLSSFILAIFPIPDENLIDNIQPIKTDKSSYIFRQAKQYIDTTFYEPITVQYVAKKYTFPHPTCSAFSKLISECLRRHIFFQREWKKQESIL